MTVCVCVPAMCVQGWYDPDCILVPPFETGVASGGEGCYRCPNGGNCTAPDFCTCTEEWQGYDCRTREWLLPCLDKCAAVAHTVEGVWLFTQRCALCMLTLRLCTT